MEKVLKVLDHKFSTCLYFLEETHLKYVTALSPCDYRVVWTGSDKKKTNYNHTTVQNLKYAKIFCHSSELILLWKTVYTKQKRRINSIPILISE